MKADMHSEEELKNVLRGLFAEKKRIKEQQKNLEEGAIQKKFQALLSESHARTLSEDIPKLKQKIQEKDEEISHYQDQLEKIKPAIKKLVSDLNHAKEEIERIKDEKMSSVLPEKELQIQELKKIIEKMRAEQLQYEEELQGHELLKKAFAVKEEELAQAYAQEQKETARIEAERVKLVERLAENLSHVQRQTEIIQELQEELSKERRLEKSDLTAIKEEYENKLREQQEAYQNARSMCQEKESEIRQAQQHLAKKVKETTILRDLTERQKMQLSDQQMLLNKQKGELEHLQNQMNLQKIHEEKIQLMAKERTQSAEVQTKEWQEKYLCLQKEWQELKEQMIDLQKIRKNYEYMTTTFSNLKTLLGKMPEESEGE